MKICATCKEEKPLNEFWTRSKIDLRPRYSCKACHYLSTRTPNGLRYQHAYRRLPHVKWKQRERETGFSQTLFDDTLALQNGLCPICHRALLSLTPYRKGWSPLHADHDHATHKPRGILCQDCNTGLGWFRDNPALLRAAATYLEHPPLELI